MKARIVDWLLGVVIGIIFILIVQPKRVDYTKVLNQKDRYYKHKIDSINNVIADLVQKDTLWAHTVYMLRIEKSKASQSSDYYRKKYENLKNTPVPSNLSQQQYDSLLSTLIPR